MKQFTNKQECLDWIVDNYDSKNNAVYNYEREWDCEFELNLNDIIKAFENKHTDLDSKQQLEQRVVESFGDVDLNNKLGSVEFLDDKTSSSTTSKAIKVNHGDIGKAEFKRIKIYHDGTEIKIGGERDFADGFIREMEKRAVEIYDAVKKPNKYIRNLKGVECDVYDVLKAFDVTCPALQHLIKKALCAGLRGHKDKPQDLKDILDSAKRAVELNDTEVE